MAAASPRPFRFAVQAFEATSGKEWPEVARRDGGPRLQHPVHHRPLLRARFDRRRRSGHRPVDVAPIAAMTAAAAVTTEPARRVPRLQRRPPSAGGAGQGDGHRSTCSPRAGWRSASGPAGSPPSTKGSACRWTGPACASPGLGEVVELMKAHWSGDEVAVDGTYVHAHGFAGLPLPVQQPHPPIFIGGGRERILDARRAAGRHRQLQLRQLRRARSARRAWPAPAPARPPRSSSGCVPGAGDRFDEIELEIGAYFVSVDEDPGPTIAAMATRFGVSERGVRHPTPTPCSAASNRSAPPCRSAASSSASPTSPSHNGTWKSSRPSSLDCRARDRAPIK